MRASYICRPLLLPLLLSRPNPSPDAVRFRDLTQSTLAHDAVAAAVLHKHHSIIRVGAGLIQFVYGSHSHLAMGVTSSRILFQPFFRARFDSYQMVVGTASSAKISKVYSCINALITRNTMSCVATVEKMPRKCGVCREPCLDKFEGACAGFERKRISK